MPKKPPGGTRFTEFSVVILQWLYRDAHGKKEIKKDRACRAHCERDLEYDSICVKPVTCRLLYVRFAFVNFEKYYLYLLRCNIVLFRVLLWDI